MFWLRWYPQVCQEPVFHFDLIDPNVFMMQFTSSSVLAILASFDLH